MFKNKPVNKGVVLLLVIGSIAIIGMLCSFFLRIILSQYKLTTHQVNRIQSYYAGLAAMNYALAQLSTGTWQYSASPPPVNTCPGPSGCVVPNDFGSAITAVKVIFCPANLTCAPATTPCYPPAGTTFCINSTATYTSPDI